MSATKLSFNRASGLLRASDYSAAADTCRAALSGAPDDVDLLTLYGVALLRCKLPREAEAPLQRAVTLAPRFARAREHFGQALMLLGRLEEAREELQRAAALEPQSESVRLKLAHVLASMGKADEADSVYETAFGLAPDKRRLAEAAEHLRYGRLAESEQLCKELLEKNPDDVNALRIRAKTAGEQDRWPRAERLLRRVLTLAPDFHDARLDLAGALKRLGRLDEALECTSTVIQTIPHAPFARYVHAGMLAVCGRHDEALDAYRYAIRLRAYFPAAYVGMGHLLKTLGRTEDGIAAYRAAIEQQPGFGEAYFSLSNLKTFHFDASEIVDIERRLETDALDDDARVHLLFTLGKAYEDRQEFERSFSTYAEACALQRLRVSYDPVETEVMHDRICEVFTANFLARHAGQGCTDPAPIFIVGLPRSGSTLIEQILASHSMVEGTAELPDVARAISSLATLHAGEVYPNVARRLDAAGWRELGEAYLARTQRHRNGLPFFTDKMPNNFSAIGLIHLMLPNAKIIDARRHPLDSCFGTFKQLFAHGQTFSYDLFELGEFYREYRRMMRHWHRVLPGLVLEVRYEDIVADQEMQTRRLLDYCGLPWEESCLRYYETERAVRTASSEQVRQPIYATSVNRWRNVREQLAPLIDVLGDELEGWDS